MNSLVNHIKVAAIKTTDIINSTIDPFEEFTRQGVGLDTTGLAEKFESHLKEKFLDPSTGIWQYELPWNSGDQCIWHGITTAMWAIKGNSEDELRGSVRAIEHFLTDNVVKRGIVGGIPQYEVSSDQISGLLCGMYFAWKYGTSLVRIMVIPHIARLGRIVLDSQFKLRNPDGSETKHGKLINGYLTDPLNLGIALAIMKLCHEIMPGQEYGTVYDNLVDLYKPLIPYGKVKLLWRDNSYDTHRAAISYSILCDLEKDHELHHLYTKGIDRLWEMERKSANPWVYYLLRRVSYYRPEDLDNVKKHLTEFTFSAKINRQEKINSTSVDTIKWGKRLRARQPIPRYKMGSQDFFWQRNMYSVDDWEGQKEPVEVYNGVDYLIALYGLKQLRLI